MTKHTLYSSISPKIVIRITTHIKLRAVQQLIIAELAGHRPAWPGNSSTDCPSTLHAGSNRKCLSAELNCKQSPLIKSTCSIKNGAGCHATSDDPCMLQLDGYAKCCCLQFLAAQQHASLAYKRPTCTLTQLNSTMPHTTHSQHLIRCQPDIITADSAAWHAAPHKPCSPDAPCTSAATKLLLATRYSHSDAYATSTCCRSPTADQTAYK